jgi:thiol:disulfide interchange protein DsbC
MKKLVLGLSMAAMALQAYAMSEKELEKYKNNDLLKSEKMVFVAGKDLGDGLAMIKGYSKTDNGNIPFQLITNNKVVITSSGQVFDTTTRKEIKIEVDLDTKELKKKAAYTLGNGKNEYFLFTEAECPACQQFHKTFTKESLIDDAKVHVFMYPLNFHLLAKDMSIATLSQPIEKRHDYYEKIMYMQPIDAVKELEKYSFNVYERVLNGVNSFDTREAQLVQKYIKYFENANNTKFNSRDEVVAFCKKKIESFKKDEALYSRYQKVEKLLNEQLNEVAPIFGVNGTPTLFDAQGNQVNRDIVLKRN